MTDAPDDTVFPLPLPEVAAGRRLDADHDPVAGEGLCGVCGFSTDDSVSPPVRHYPSRDELALVTTWLEAYGAREDS